MPLATCHVSNLPESLLTHLLEVEIETEKQSDFRNGMFDNQAGIILVHAISLPRYRLVLTRIESRKFHTDILGIQKFLEGTL